MGHDCVPCSKHQENEAGYGVFSEVEITEKYVLSLKPCIPPRVSRAFAVTFGGKSQVSVIEVLQAARPEGIVHYSDALWLIVRPQLLRERTLREFSCSCVEHRLRYEINQGLEPETEIREALSLARGYARGRVTPAELLDAEALARAVWRRVSREGQDVAAGWTAQAAAHVCSGQLDRVAQAAFIATWKEGMEGNLFKVREERWQAELLWCMLEQGIGGSHE